MLGRHGASGNFSHLHVGVYLSEADRSADRLCRNLNLYPWLIAAYETGAAPELHAVARPHHSVLTGDRVFFDGRNSFSSHAPIRSFRWQFPDGTTVSGPVAEKVFARPGCYPAALWIEDSQGWVDVDFCKVKVFTRGAPEESISTLFVTYHPSGGVRVNDPVNFRAWPQSMSVASIQIDFGDGTLIEDYQPYSALTHNFTKPGLHIVTVTGNAGALPVIQKLKVLVR
jgi:hypothetical protein